MKPVCKIKLTHEMQSAAAAQLFAIVQGAHKEPRILFVGGCVRDCLLGRAIGDLDLATILPPEDIMKMLTMAGVKVVPTGIDHGTVTAVIDGIPFQITTLRRDVETDGRRAVVTYTDDWVEDARRRDFTLNTLLCDIKGRVFDPLGCGIDDLEKGRIVFVGEAAERIREDYLRILRFFRFQAWFGKGKMDGRAVQACVANRGGLKNLSIERVTEEILKLLRSGNAARSLSVMADNRILPQLVRADLNIEYFKQLKVLDKNYFETLGLLILANFSHFGARRIEKHLRLPNRIVKQMDSICSLLKEFKKVTPDSMGLLLYRTDRQTAEIVLIFRLLRDAKTAAYINKKLAELALTEKPVLPISGRDLIARGMKEGPEIRKALLKAERAWIKNGFTAPAKGLV